MNERFTGKVKWFNRKDGYGFIVPDAGGKDIFFHRNQCEKAGLDADALQENDAVSYVIREFRGKNQAEDLAAA